MSAKPRRKRPRKRNATIGAVIAAEGAVAVGTDGIAHVHATGNVEGLPEEKINLTFCLAVHAPVAVLARTVVVAALDPAIANHLAVTRVVFGNLRKIF